MSAITLKGVLSKLKNVGRNGQGYTALCPAHDDKRNSLSVNESSDGRVLLKCHAGCSFDQILAALSLSSPNNSHNSKSSRRIVATYDYRDEAGMLLYQVVRYEPKGFSQGRPDGNGGFTDKRDGVRLVLYRLPEILKADQSQVVFICEGEKDADTLIAHGLIATTNSGGVGKWREVYSTTLESRHVVILPDNDDAGKKHAERVARSLYGKAESIRVVNLPNLPIEGDVSDWLESGGTIKRLLELVENAPVYEDVGRLSTFLSWGEFMSIKVSQAAPIAFTLKRGEIGLLSAVTNIGKSTLIRNASLALACGSEFLPVIERGQPRRVLLLDFESSLERLQPDLQGMSNAFAVNEQRLVRENFFVACDRLINDEPLSLSNHMDRVSRYAKAKKIDLIVVDTMSAAFDLRDENDNAEVTRRVLKPLRNLARKVKAALLIIHHIGKSGSEGSNQSDSIYKSRGASALGCHATAVFNLTAKKDDPSLITLECVKRKDGQPTNSTMLRLNLTSRWFELVPTPQTKQSPSAQIQQLLKSHKNGLKRADIVKALKGKVPERTIDRCLKDGVQNGTIGKSQQGIYTWK